MALDSKQKKEFVAQSHALKPIVIVGRAGLQPAHVETLRDHLKRHDLAKVRIDAESGADADAVASHIAATVPCELVARRGYVAIFHSQSGGGRFEFDDHSDGDFD